MIKMVFLVHRRPDLSSDEFRKYWRENHSQIAAEIPGLRKYIQHHAEPRSDGSAPPYDGFAEMWYDDAESLERAMETPEGKAAQADTENFLDLDRLLAFSVDQVTVV